MRRDIRHFQNMWLKMKHDYTDKPSCLTNTIGNTSFYIIVLWCVQLEIVHLSYFFNIDWHILLLSIKVKDAVICII